MGGLERAAPGAEKRFLEAVGNELADAERSAKDSQPCTVMLMFITAGSSLLLEGGAPWYASRCCLSFHSF